jgi:hypothetical protein
MLYRCGCTTMYPAELPTCPHCGQKRGIVPKNTGFPDPVPDPVPDPNEVPEEPFWGSPFGTEFDPSRHTVREVNTYLDSQPDTDNGARERARIYAEESHGKNRAGIMDRAAS